STSARSTVTVSSPSGGPALRAGGATARRPRTSRSRSGRTPRGRAPSGLVSFMLIIPLPADAPSDTFVASRRADGRRILYHASTAPQRAPSVALGNHEAPRRNLMRRVALLLVLLAGGCTWSDSETERTVQDVLESQVTAWNKGDIGAFLSSYWNS